MIRALAAGALFALALAAAAAGAVTHTVILPSPTDPLDARLPLTAPVGVLPTRLPPTVRVANDQHIEIGVTADGRVARVRVRQRLTLRGLGDYFFRVVAPLRDVRALPESQVEPGLRSGSVLWQGFSPGRRVLAAELELDPAAAAPALPLEIRREGRRLVLRNTTGVAAAGFHAEAARAAVLPVIARVRALAAGAPAGERLNVAVSGETSGRRIAVDAPLAVEGTVRTRAEAPRRIALRLGGDAPDAAAVDAPAGAAVDLVVTPESRLPELDEIPAGANGRDLLLRAQTALLRLARVQQYRTFLAAPAPGAASAVYRFRTVAAGTAPAAGAGDERDDGGPALLLVLAGGAILLMGGLVAWAHA